MKIIHVYFIILTSAYSISVDLDLGYYYRVRRQDDPTQFNTYTGTLDKTVEVDLGGIYMNESHPYVCWNAYPPEIKVEQDNLTFVIEFAQEAYHFANGIPYYTDGLPYNLDYYIALDSQRPIDIYARIKNVSVKPNDTSIANAEIDDDTYFTLCNDDTGYFSNKAGSIKGGVYNSDSTEETPTKESNVWKFSYTNDLPQEHPVRLYIDVEYDDGETMNIVQDIEYEETYNIEIIDERSFTYNTSLLHRYSYW